MVRRELTTMFASFAPDGEPRIDRGAEPADSGERRRWAFFSDANSCVARRAWEEVQFRAVSYAEDRLLARDMLSAGWAKAYHPAAAVVHSHEYPLRQLLLRSFDEWRGMLEVNGLRGHSLARWPLAIQREVRDDMATAARPRVRATRCARPRARWPTTPPAASEPRSAARADRIPERVRRLLSLEGRGGFDPQC